MKITKDDLAPALSAHTGDRIFEQALERTTSPADLLRVMARYIHFNAVFGGGVANLAGEIAVRQDLFRDRGEAIAMLADRSVEVASDIFFAAIDEFDDRATRHRDPHRTLAQATVKAAGDFFGFSPAQLNTLLTVNPATRAAVARVRAGYGVNQVVDERKLFSAIGFHLSSEVLADGEFRALDSHLREHHPDLVRHLEQTRVRINRLQHAAYYWIRIHTTVEADHFGAAVIGANGALQYYTGTSTGETIKSWIVAGFEDFAGVQSDFMLGLRDEIATG